MPNPGARLFVVSSCLPGFLFWDFPGTYAINSENHVTAVMLFSGTDGIVHPANRMDCPHIYRGIIGIIDTNDEIILLTEERRRSARPYNLPIRCCMEHGCFLVPATDKGLYCCPIWGRC